MGNLCGFLLATLLALFFITAPIYGLEIRGTVFDLGTNEAVWTHQNFAGFYYDIDKNLGAEQLTLRLNDANSVSATISDQPDADGYRGIIYEANMQQIPALSNAKIGTTYGKLMVEEINSTTGMITLDNKDNQITLTKNKTIELMPGIRIKTADQSTINADIPLRYCIYKEVTKPGTYELRGAVADSSSAEYTYNDTNFPGFYYDIDKNMGAEQMIFRLSNVNLTGATLSDQLNVNGDRGIVYTTAAQPRNFKFKPWGQYMEIGFLGDRYFAAYDSTVTSGIADAGEVVSFLYDRSKNRNLMTNEQLSKILIDDDTTRLVKKGQSLKLRDGYELSIEGVNSEGQVHLKLIKNGQTVDESFISPSISDARMADKTYYYKKDLGNTNSIVLIAVHVRSVYKDVEQPMAIVDGIWQISDVPTYLTPAMRYGKMSIKWINPSDMSILMDNKGNPINLTKKLDVEIIPFIHLRTADNETLRYYIYKTETIT